MKRIIYILSSLAFMFGFFSACSEETVPLYNGCKSGLFIQQMKSFDIYGNPISYQDSATISFTSVKDDVMTYVVSFYVQTMGDVVNYDRPYKIEVMEGTTAVEGVDYDLDRNDFIINANQSRDTLRVTCHRTPKLRDEILRVKIGILPNEHFEVPLEQYKNSSSWSVNGPMNSATSYIIRFSEIYDVPFYWEVFGVEYFGEFTVNRMLELNKVMGWTYADWVNSGTKVVAGKFDFAARMFQQHLQKRADEGNPLIDDDGKTYVQLPAKYAVDYSHIGSKE